MPKKTVLITGACGEIGQALLDKIPNTRALYWVDFTVLDVFPPDELLP